ncbi:G-patch domain containing protein, putative [Leishmania lindenbergi]|uniref:G-patch domain containing protein n=1 Tax=Leishmania lindenbergi TaxID=651832 RepID=A0AAW3B2R3_9TRYP
MSALAKKMMEKYGWKEGEGLGKERTGTKSYVKVTRRDPHTATGLGHAADPAQGGSLASSHAVELDAIYGQLCKVTRKRQQQPNKSHVDQADASEGLVDSEDELSDVSSTRSCASSSNANNKPEEEVSAAARAPVKRQRRVLSSSLSNSNSEDDNSSDDVHTSSKRLKSEHVGDVTRMSDKELLQRCGGVRLGRAGRHRFFDGKLKRIRDAS